MSRSRNTVLCVAVGLTALVLNSTAAYLLGLTPAVFSGVMFWLLLTVWGISWAAYVLVTRADRRDATERVRNYSHAIAYARRQRPSYSSGSRQRPTWD